MNLVFFVLASALRGAHLRDGEAVFFYFVPSVLFSSIKQTYTRVVDRWMVDSKIERDSLLSG